MKIDVEFLKILFEDKTTGKNILWATSDYKNIAGDEEVQLEQINLIKLRFEKFREQQKNRTRDKAEIFTPSWICNEQNNLIDEAWFGRADVFNKIIDEQNHIWQPISGKIFFEGERNWQSYVETNRLEVTCGEAPYLASRYDTVSGDSIPVENRIGLLDRKLRVVSENTNDVEDWLNWTKKSLRSIYGYEFQGDNLFIARCNVFLTVKEFFLDKYKFGCDVYPDFLKEVAEIISWNLWQMNGLTNAIPYYEPPVKDFVQSSLFEPKNVYCRIKDWQTNEELEYRSLEGA